MQGVLSEEPERPSARADVPVNVDEILAPALEKEPTERYDSIVYLRDELEALFASLRETGPAQTSSTAVGQGTDDEERGQTGRDEEESVQQSASAGADSRTRGQEQHPPQERSQPEKTSPSSSETGGLPVSRRQALGGMGAAALGGTALVLSSLGGDESPNRDDSGNGDGSGNGNGNNSFAGGGNGVGNGGGNMTGNGDPSAPQEILDSYLSDNHANFYEGTDSIVDETGSDSVTVTVGAGSNRLAFDPPAVRVSSGTTVTWEWTGEGGPHNVVADEVPEGGTEFDSGEVVAEGGTTYEATLETAGAYGYYCAPHQAQGMHGGIIVSERRQQ
jgi:halocyanin-like protein